MLKTINEILGTDKPILAGNENIPEDAFTQDGIEQMGENIMDYKLSFYRAVEHINHKETVFESWYIKKK